MISKLIFMYLITFGLNMVVFGLAKAFFPSDENITFENNLKISAVLSLITVVVALVKGV